VVTPATRHADIEVELLAGNGAVISHPTLMLRRDFLTGVGGYDERYKNCAEDLDLYLKLAEAGSLANLPESLLHFRMDGGRSSKGSLEATRIRETYENQILKETWKRRGLFGVPPVIMHQPFDAAEMHYGIAHLARAGENFRCARKHLLAAIRAKPERLKHWKLLCRCTAAGHWAARGLRWSRNRQGMRAGRA
jgi:GT2 family glycosyltransferase